MLPYPHPQLFNFQSVDFISALLFFFSIPTMLSRSVRSLQPRLSSVAYFSSSISTITKATTTLSNKDTNAAQTVAPYTFEDPFADEMKTYPLEKLSNVLLEPPLVEPCASVNASPLGWGEERDNYEAVIYKPSRIVTQNHHGEPTHWQIKFNLQKQWQNGLMGWQSGTGVTACLNTHMTFPSRKHAVDYAQNYGIKFTIRDPVERKKSKPKSYAENFTKYEATGEW